MSNRKPGGITNPETSMWGRGKKKSGGKAKVRPGKGKN